MNRLDRRSRSQDNLILEKRFTRIVLREEGQEILRQQTRKMRGSGFKSRELFTSRKINVTDTVLSYEHLAKHRFIDMKRRRTVKGVITKKNYAIHNRILYGVANNIVRRISFGFTDSTRQIMQGIK